MSAGLAATGASFVTSRFGVAGTLLGAALTAMIITGGSAILRAYLETLSGRVRQVPTKLRSRREQKSAGGSGDIMPGRPDLRDNFVGRMRAALGWFSHLTTLRRRSILMRGLLAAVVALLLCLALVWGTEKLIGNSLSCGLWAKCPYGATPGIHPFGYGGTGADSSLSGGATAGVEKPGLVDRVRQNGNPFGGDQPVVGNPGGGAAPSASPEPSPAPGGGSAPPAGGQESASPAAGGQDAPSSVAPKARQQAAPSTASPAAGQ
ncbi:hypothetical protein BH18ACT11_BH18ACT11_16350 [soil metagenome]